MADPKSTTRPTTPNVHDSEPQRPDTLRRRISLGFSTFIAALPLRRSTSHQEPISRPSTAPIPDRPPVRPSTHTPQTPGARPPIPQIHIPSLAEPSQPCPYDETKYHSFSSIERPRCIFCGMRSPYSPSSSEPCKECRSKNPFSHVKLGFGQSFNMRSRKGVRPSRPEFLLGGDEEDQEEEEEEEEVPRLVPPEIAARRIGNPPRRAVLPVPRMSDVLLNPSKRQGSISSSKSSTPRPQSPKLHYLHGLPDSHSYPYVHKSEVPKHFAALRARSPSPLAEFAVKLEQAKKKQDRSTDFSETVYYGRTPRPALVGDVEKKSSGGEEERRRGSVVVVQEETLRLGGRIAITERLREDGLDERLCGEMVPELQQAQVGISRLHSSRTASPGSDTSTSPGTQPTKGKDGAGAEPSVRLRGGDGGNEQDNKDYPHSWGILIKQLLLTCHRPRRRGEQEVGSSDEEESLQPRIADPVRVARTKRRNEGTARIPRGVCRGVSGTAKIPSINDGGDGDVVTATHNPLSSPICIFQPFNCPSSSLSFYRTPSDSSTINVPDPKHIPCLRGGASPPSPSSLHDNENLPPTLFWLAGGSRRPVRAKTWKAKRPEKRMGGWLGWAVHGMKAGEAYGSADGKDGKVESVETSGEKAESVKSSGGKSRGSQVEEEKTGSVRLRGPSRADGGAAAEVVVETGGDVAAGSVKESGEGDTKEAVKEGGNADPAPA